MNPLLSFWLATATYVEPSCDVQIDHVSPLLRKCVGAVCPSFSSALALALTTTQKPTLCYKPSATPYPCEGEGGSGALVDGNNLNITLRSGAGDGRVVIDCAGRGRAFHIKNATVHLYGLTLQNGTVDSLISDIDGVEGGGLIRVDNGKCR